LNQPQPDSTINSGIAPPFEEIVSRCQDMVYNTALSILQSEEDAEDITQEVFIKVYEKRDHFRGEALLSTWIYRITVNKALDLEKKKKRQKHGGFITKLFGDREEEEAINFHHPGVVLDNKEKAAMLFKALKKLPESQRIAFTLHKIEGLPYQEIAAVMETSLVAVESLMARAKTSLQKILKTYYLS
jgi:RNA polymerase sigma factor (sigma-70 family)